MEIREIESRFEACKATVLPLNYIPISAQGGSRIHKTTALNRVHMPILLLGHNSTWNGIFRPNYRGPASLTRAILPELFLVLPIAHFLNRSNKLNC